MSTDKFTPDMIWKRRIKSSIIQKCLDLQKVLGWTDAETFGIMACYLSDALESTTKELDNALNEEITRCAFLGNAARAMYEALKATEVILRLSNHDFGTNDMGKFRNITLRSTHREVLAAIAKAEGRS